MAGRNDGKQNIALIIGLSIPVAMVVFIAIAINGPRWLAAVDPPRYNFLYATGQQNPYARYLVKAGRLTFQESVTPEGAVPMIQNPVRFFVHDVAENISAEITETEAQALSLDGSVRSPDGFSVKAGRRGGWLFFPVGRGSESSYLIKENYRMKLNLENRNGAYNFYWNNRFLGWVTGDE